LIFEQKWLLLRCERHFEAIGSVDKDDKFYVHYVIVKVGGL